MVGTLPQLLLPAINTLLLNAPLAGGTDVEMEFIPSPGLYSGTYLNRPSLTAEPPRNMSPIQSRSSTPVPATTTAAFTSPFAIPVPRLPTDTTTSQPSVPGLLTNGTLFVSASMTPEVSAPSLNVHAGPECADTPSYYPKR